MGEIEAIHPFAWRALALLPRHTHNISGSIHHRARLTEPKIPTGSHPNQQSLFPFNHIDR
jgi:hypothetical protein